MAEERDGGGWSLGVEHGRREGVRAFVRLSAFRCIDCMAR